MVDRRKRIYYTKSQITEGLVTKGKEWMLKDNVEYIGQYHTYATGEVFSEASFVERKSRILIPYLDVTAIQDSLGIGINPSANSEYDAVKKIKITKSKILNPTNQPISDDDFIKGYMVRYFAYKVNDGQLVELSKDKFGKIGTEDGMDIVLWKKLKVKWKLTGPDYDVIDKAGNIKEAGIIDTNTRTIAVLSEEYPEFLDYITDYREFAKN